MVVDRRQKAAQGRADRHAEVDRQAVEAEPPGTLFRRTVPGHGGRVGRTQRLSDQRYQKQHRSDLQGSGQVSENDEANT